MGPRARVGMLVVVALLATSCGDDAEPAASPAAEPGDGVDGEVAGDLVAYGFGYDTGDVIATSRVDVFREAYPDVDVRFSESGFDEQQFLSALASDRPPDVVNIPRNQLGSYIARGVLAPMDDCIEREDVDTSVFYDAAMDQVTLDEQVWALPEFLLTRVWILNDAAFEDAGLDPATVDLADRDAMAETNETLTRTENGQVQRIGLDPKLPEFLPLWAWAAGAPLLSDDGREARLDDPVLAEVLDELAAWHEPAGGRTAFLDLRDTWDFFGADNQYVTGELAGMPMEQWYLNVLAESSPDVEVTVRPFETPDGSPLTWADGNSWAITANAQNPATACAFAATMTDADTWIAAAEARVAEREQEGAPNTGVFTGNQQADEVIFTDLVDLSEAPVFEQAVEQVLEQQTEAFGLPPSPAAAAVEAAWTDATNAVLSGEDAATALQAAQAEAQAAIDAADR